MGADRVPGIYRGQQPWVGRQMGIGALDRHSDRPHRQLWRTTLLYSGGEHRVPPSLAWVGPDGPEEHLTVHLTVSICLCLCVSLSGITSPCPSARSLQPARASILHLDHVSRFLECSTRRTFLPIPHLPWWAHSLCPLSRAWAGVTAAMSPNPGSCSLLQDPSLAMPQTPPPAPSSMPCLFFVCHMLRRKVRRVWMDTQRAGV